MHINSKWIINVQFLYTSYFRSYLYDISLFSSILFFLRYYLKRSMTIFLSRFKNKYCNSQSNVASYFLIYLILFIFIRSKTNFFYQIIKYTLYFVHFRIQCKFLKYNKIFSILYYENEKQSHLYLRYINIIYRLILRTLILRFLLW